ncbi:MAG: hypothetical protein RLZZ569_462 [Bacteroidota bacterium]|jgi:hypothetical protein
MKQLTLLLLIIVLTGCKQKHTCACSNPGGVFETHIIKGTVTEAKSKCAEIDASHQTMPWSETFCELVD